MQPFDLKRALAGDPVVTRDGMPVHQIHVFDRLSCKVVYGVFDGYVEQWDNQGRYLESRDSGHDLFMAEPAVDVTAELVKALGDALSLLRCYRYNCSSDLDEDEVIASCKAALALAYKESK